MSTDQPAPERPRRLGRSGPPPGGERLPLPPPAVGAAGEPSVAGPPAPGPDRSPPLAGTARPARSRRRRWARRFGLVGLGAVGIVVVGLSGVLFAATRVDLPENKDFAQVSVVYYRDGATEIGRVGAENRTDVPLETVPVHVRQAVLAAEDRGFYTNPGISPRGVARALWANIRGQEVSQGGSTITQQYAKNAYLTQERTFTRKIREIFIAIKLDRTYSKDQVLEWYLNTIYFGRSAYGIEAAAQTYFAKPAAALTLEEGAVLASSIRSPGLYDPERNPENAKGRFRYVLDGMAGEGWLAPEVAAGAAFPTVQQVQRRSDAFKGSKGYVLKAVADELERRGYSEDLLTRGGLRVTTTLDARAQGAAAGAVTRYLRNGRTAAPPELQAAVVSVEPGTGAIRGMYAGEDYVERPFNNAMQGSAQAGSTFKPFVLAAALSRNISLRTTYDGSSPRTFPGYPSPGVKNFGSGDGTDFGRIDLVTATANSVNTVYVELGLDAGLPTVEATARAAGITTDMSKESGSPSFPLGTSAVRPVDAAAAYATFANRGQHAPPYLVQTVTQPSRDRTVLETEVQTRQAFSAAVAADATFAMQAVVERGTAARADLAGGRPAAGKTGSTTNNTAAWMVGFTPQLSTAVVLFNDPPGELQNVLGLREVTGGSVPAQIWKATMDTALEGAPETAFPKPAYVGKADNPGRETARPARPRSPVPTAPTTRRPAPSTAPSAGPSLVAPSAGPSTGPSTGPSAAPSVGPPRRSGPPTAPPTTTGGAGGSAPALVPDRSPPAGAGPPD